MNRYVINIIVGDSLIPRTIEANSHAIRDGMIMFYERTYDRKEADDVSQPTSCYPADRTMIANAEYDVENNDKHNEVLRWKDVFNTRLKVTGWGDISQAAKAAHDSGYKYFDWNDRVYETTCNRTEVMTWQLL